MAVVPVQGAIVVVTVESMAARTYSARPNMSNCIGASTPSEESLKNAKGCSPPRLVKTGAVFRASRVCTAASHCSTDNRQSRRGSGGSGVQATLDPPVPVVEPPVPVFEPPVPVFEPPVPVFEPPLPVFEPPLPVFEPPLPVFEPPLPVFEPPLPVVEPPVPVMPLLILP